MIRGRGYRPYKPPQYLTGRVDDFPLVPETPVDIVPRPILQAAAPTAEEQTAPAAAGLTAEGPVAAVPAAPVAAPAAAVPPKPVRNTINIVVQPDPRKKPAQNERKSAANYKEMGVAKLQTLYDWIGLTLSDRGVPPPEPQFPRTSRHRARRAARSGATKSKSHPASARDHHSRHCTICNHPERAAIEEEFIHWHDPSEIGFDYEVGRRAVYRHAHAAGLFARRERNMRFALGHMVQRAMNIKPTSDSILRAIRAYSCLNRRGQWTEPASHVVVSSGSAALANQRLPSRVLEAVPGSSPAEVQPPEKSRTRKRKLPVTASRVERDAND
jgi:hypothetical protein